MRAKRPPACLGNWLLVTLLLRMVSQTQQRLANALGDLVDGPIAVDLGKAIAMFAIVLDDRGGLLFEATHAFMKGLRGVVCALDECGAIEVADAVLLRRL